MLNHLQGRLSGNLKQQWRRSATAIAMALLAFASVTLAAERGRIEGVVSDQAGAKISGARVIIHDQTGAIVAEARSDQSGQFNISGVASGRYTITAEADGFKFSEAMNVDVPASGAASVSLRLEVAAIADH